MRFLFFCLSLSALASSWLPALAEEPSPEPTPVLKEETMEKAKHRDPFWEGLESEVDENTQADRFDLFEPETETALDTQAANVARTLDQFVNKADTFFVDERVDTMYRGNRLRLRTGLTLQERGRSDIEFKIRIDLRLPRTEGKLGIFAESLSVEETGDGTTRGKDDDDAFTTGLRWFLTDPEVLESKIDLGVKWDPTPEPFIRLRLSKDYPLGNEFLFRPTSFLKYQIDDGAEFKLRADFDHRVARSALLRSRSEMKWSEQSVSDGHNVEWYQSFAHYMTFSDLRGIRSEARVDGVTKPSYRSENYVLAFLWRQAAYKDWLFYEIEPFLEWDRGEDFDAMPGITFLVEFNFQGAAGSRPVTERLFSEQLKETDRRAFWDASRTVPNSMRF